MKSETNLFSLLDVLLLSRIETNKRESAINSLDHSEIRGQVQHRRSSSAEMPLIKKGDKLPSVTLYEALPENQTNILNLVANKKAIIFGVPGAFVPGCSRVHLRGFIEK